MPKYYVVKGIKIDLRYKNFKNVTLFHWDDITFDSYNKTNNHWHKLAVSLFVSICFLTRRW